MAKTKTTSNKMRNAASKQDKIISLLKRPKGASLADIGKATDWQEHSIRGFMSGTLKKRLNLSIESDKDSRGVRKYRIVDSVKRSDQAAKAESGA